MVSRLLSWGWRRRPSVATERYALLLNDALKLAATYRASDVVARELGLADVPEPTAEQGQALLRELMEEFSIFQVSVQRLEKIKPAPPELLELHMRSVGFLRGVIEIKGRATAIMLAIGQGKYPTVAKLQKESDHWLGVLPGVHGDFANELRQVRDKQPQTYAEIGIPETVLDELNLH
jgi:hypothetical protein